MKECLLKARKGNTKAIENILAKYELLIIKMSNRYHIFDYDREEIKQIAIESVLSAINSIDINRSKYFTAYVEKAIRNNFAAEIRKAVKRYNQISLSKEINKSIELQHLLDGGVNIEQEYLLNETKEKLYKAIGTLSKADKELLKAVYVDKRTLTDYAREKKMVYHQAKYKKEKILLKLKQLLK